MDTVGIRRRQRSARGFWTAGVGWLALGAIAQAQHLDILVQAVDGKLVTGVSELEGGGFTLGARVFTGEFPLSFAENDPGFNAIASGSAALPPGAAALPGNADLDWDFLSMTIDGQRSALFYWDGLGTTAQDVEFQTPPGENYALSLFGKGNEFASAVIADALIPGRTLETTASSGFLHEHRFFFLDDGDGDDATAPAEGVYLIAMQLRMADLATSDPFFLLWGTPDASTAALELAARPWVQARVDQLIVEAIPGDFNADGLVDGADLLAWQRWSGMTVAPPGGGADANGDGIVDQEDLPVWEMAFGASMDASLSAASIPEPHAAALGALASLVLASRRERRRTR